MSTPFVNNSFAYTYPENASIRVILNLEIL